MIEGGHDRSWLRPHDVVLDQIAGTHRGNSEALNVGNPQPGWHYYYARRDNSFVQRYLNNGWRPVTATDPETWGVSHHEDIPELDGLVAFKDVILLKIPEEQWRALQERKAELTRRDMTGPEEEYLRQGDNLTRQTHSDDDLYYKKSDHGFSTEGD